MNKNTKLRTIHTKELLVPKQCCLKADAYITSNRFSARNREFDLNTNIMATTVYEYS